MIGAGTAQLMRTRREATVLAMLVVLFIGLAFYSEYFFTSQNLANFARQISVVGIVALGQALGAGETRIEAIVSLRHPRPREQHRDCKVVSPCGICREMLTDFAAGCAVIVPGATPEQPPRRVPVEQLLPEKYRRQP